MLFVFATKAQEIVHFEDIEDKIEQDIDDLDQTYISGVNPQPGQSYVFEGREKEFNKHFREMFLAISTFLSESGFKWEAPSPALIRVYFDEHGKLDYLIYQFKDQLSPSKQRDFEFLLKGFFEHYTFPVKPYAKFAQIMPAKFVDAKPE